MGGIRRLRLLAAVAAVGAGALAAVPAQAADIMVAVVPAPPPPPPPPDPFDGPYVGGLIGYGWFYKDWLAPVEQGPITPTQHTAAGLLIGAEAGFRIQNGNLVFGIEADWAWTNAYGASDCSNANICFTDVHWLATATGQAGFALQNTLLYVEAGAGLVRETFGIEASFTNTLFNFGWLIGGGAVLSTDSGLYVKLEYNYINFGTETVLLNEAPLIEPDIRQWAHTVKLGVGMQF